MGMVFCRGCGKEIHELATTCPNCGAIQQITSTPSEQTSGYLILMPVSSLVIGIVVIIGALGFPEDSSWDKEEIAGLGYFSATSLFLGIVSLGQLNVGKGIAIAGVVLSSIELLLCVSALFG